MPIVTIEQVMRRFFDGATEANGVTQRLQRSGCDEKGSHEAHG